MSILITLYLFVLGLILGSFINALVWRLSMQLDKDGNPIKTKTLNPKSKIQHQESSDYSITKGRSMCPSCKHQLAGKDLLPVFSWLSLKGMCRYCHKPISKQYPAVELLTGVLFALSYIFWPFTLNGSEWIVFAGFLVALVCLVAMAIYDIRHTILPSKLIYVGIAVYTIALLLDAAIVADYYRFGMAFAAGLLYLAIFFSIYVMSYLANKKGLSKKDWLGFGDVRLVFLLGLIVGEPILVFFAMFAASLVGIVVTLPSIIAKKVNVTTQIPFGPFLIAGAIATFWWGTFILDWYSTTILGL